MVESIVHRTKEICWIKLRMVTFILQLFYKNRIRTVEWREVTESKKRDLTREMVHTLLISITERMRRTQRIKRSVCLTRYTSRKFERQSNPKTFMNTIRVHSFILIIISMAINYQVSATILTLIEILFSILLRLLYGR